LSTYSCSRTVAIFENQFPAGATVREQVEYVLNVAAGADPA